MRAKRYNARSLSLAAGLGASTVSEWLNPKKLKTPSFESIAQAAKALGVSLDLFVEAEPVATSEKDGVRQVALAYATLKGELQAGHWVEPKVYALEDAALIPLVPHPEFAGAPQYAWRVVGRSMDRLVKPDSYVVGVSFYEIGRRRLQDDDVVVCERSDGHKHEYTLKRARKTADGYRLDPESDDPRFQEPVWLSEDPHSENETVRATHLIIGTFAFFR